MVATAYTQNREFSTDVYVGAFHSKRGMAKRVDEDQQSFSSRRGLVLTEKKVPGRKIMVNIAIAFIAEACRLLSNAISRF
jgi:hypothetical protein